MRHELNLWENAIDSLNEGLRCYARAIDGDVGAYKFAVTNVTHFLELMFKRAIQSEHRLLLHRIPSARDLKPESMVGFGEAIILIQHLGFKLNPQFLEHIKAIQYLRNQIMHSHVQIDDDAQVRNLIAVVVRDASAFAEASHSPALVVAIADDCRPTLLGLLNRR
jgi:hypothetical protein